uniref:Ras-GEF domain-containing protein n=1 Tax=Rhabditophanes sp. KR3021 TaxID=114890 RepID=A0AC35TNC1_9BILA
MHMGFDQFSNWSPFIGSNGSPGFADTTSKKFGYGVGSKSIFLDRVYQIFSESHPLLTIDNRSVSYVCNILERLFYELLESKPSNTQDIEKQLNIIFPRLMAFWAVQHVKADKLLKFSKKKEFAQDKSMNTKTRFKLFKDISKQAKQYLGNKIPLPVRFYLLSVLEYTAESILQWGGNFAKNIEANRNAIKNGPKKLEYNNLLTAIKADTNLSAFEEYLMRNESGYEGFLPIESTLAVLEENFGNENEKAQNDELDYDKILAYMRKDVEKYTEHLNMLIYVFKKNMDSAFASLKLPEDYIEKIFGNIEEIYDLTAKVECILDDAIEMPDVYCIGKDLVECVEGMDFECYKNYKSVFEIGTVIFERMVKDENLKKYFDKEDLIYKNTPNGTPFRMAIQYLLPDFLKAPVKYFFQFTEQIAKLQTLTRDKDEKQALKTCSDCFYPLRTQLETALSAIPGCTLKTDIAASKAFPLRDTKSLLYKEAMRKRDIQSSIDGWQGTNIVATSTRFIHEGVLMKHRLNGGSVTDTIKGKFSSAERYVFLFDQSMVVTKKLSQPKTVVKPTESNSTVAYRFKDQLKMKCSEVLDLEDCESYQNAFKITTYSDIRTPNAAPSILILSCKSKEEKDKWMFSFADALSKTLLQRILDNYQKEEANLFPLYLPNAKKYKFAEENREDNIEFEDYTHNDGTHIVKSATLTKLIERLTYHQYQDTEFLKTFLTTYRSFCSSSELLDLLVARFNIPIPDELAGANNDKAFNKFRSVYQRPVQQRVLVIMKYWSKDHWYDFENNEQLLDKFVNFIEGNTINLTKQQKMIGKTINDIIIKQKRCNLKPSASVDHDLLELESTPTPKSPSFPTTSTQFLWHTAKPGCILEYNLLSLHPVEVARQLTIIHATLYKSVRPIELCELAWTKEDKKENSPQLLKLIHHSTMLTYYIEKCIVYAMNIEERVAVVSRTIEIMLVMEELNNFNGLVSLNAALISAPVNRLSHTWEKLAKDKKCQFDRINSYIDSHWVAMSEKLKTINPPVIPFFGTFLSKILFSEQGSKTFVEVQNKSSVPSSPLKKVSTAFPDQVQLEPEQPEKVISFMKCRKIAKIIAEIKMYQDKPYELVPEPSIKNFFESIDPLNPDRIEIERLAIGDKKDLFESAAFYQSVKIEPRNCEKLEQFKPTNTPATIKSPGIKASKTSTTVMTPATMLIAPTHSHPSSFSNKVTTFVVDQNSSNASSPQSNRSADFAIIDINPGHMPQFIANVPNKKCDAPRPIGVTQFSRDLATRLKQKPSYSSHNSPIAESDHHEITHQANVTAAPATLPRKSSVATSPTICDCCSNNHASASNNYSITPSVYAPSPRSPQEVSPPPLHPRIKGSTDSLHRIGESIYDSNSSLAENVNYGVRPALPPRANSSANGSLRRGDRSHYMENDNHQQAFLRDGFSLSQSSLTSTIAPPLPPKPINFLSGQPMVPPKSDKMKARCQQYAGTTVYPPPPPLFPRRNSVTSNNSGHSHSSQTSVPLNYGSAGTFIPPQLPPKTFKKRTTSLSRADY